MSISSSMTRTLPLMELVGECGALISRGIYRLPCGAGCGEGEFQAERGASAAPVGNFDRAAMLLNDTVGHRKPQPRALARGLRGEKRVVNAMDILRRDPVS